MRSRLRPDPVPVTPRAEGGRRGPEEGVVVLFFFFISFLIFFYFFFCLPEDIMLGDWKRLPAPALLLCAGAMGKKSDPERADARLDGSPVEGVRVAAHTRRITREHDSVHFLPFAGSDYRERTPPPPTNANPAGRRTKFRSESAANVLPLSFRSISVRNPVRSDQRRDSLRAEQYGRPPRIGR